jgi:hypothetical protein
VRSWFVPRADDLASATKYYREFLASEIPLAV